MNSKLNVCTTRAAPASALSLASLRGSNHYSLLPIARHVAPAASIGDLEMGKSDLRVRFARHSLTDIIAAASPGRALQTLEDPSYASPNNSGGTIAA
jgi:hypothetical protein